LQAASLTALDKVCSAVQKKLLFAVLLVLMLTPRPAWAYLDPSSGSMMLQLILGGLAGLGIAVKLFWGRVLSILGVGRNRGLADKVEGDSTGGG
jgi:hypothetical protein